MVYIQFTCILDYVLDNPCTICIPYVSGSFCWTEASAAALVGQGGLYIDSCLPLRMREISVNMDTKERKVLLVDSDSSVS